MISLEIIKLSVLYVHLFCGNGHAISGLLLLSFQLEGQTARGHEYKLELRVLEFGFYFPLEP
jgi:hypothetical protein